MSYWDATTCGRRRRFVVRILSAKGSYPDLTLVRPDAIFKATESLVYTVVPSEPTTEFGYTELQWADVGEIRFWGAVAFAIPEGEGSYSFYPVGEGYEYRRSAWVERMTPSLADRFAERLAAAGPPQKHDLHWRAPDPDEVSALYDALLQADKVLLRGVNCYLKAHMLWKHHWFMEEMGINLYISLEAGLATLRRRFSAQEQRDVSYREVKEHIRQTFTYGDALVDFWDDCRDDRHIVIHPDCDLGPDVMHPPWADDHYEMFDPMLSLYRYILIGKSRPTFEEITVARDAKLGQRDTDAVLEAEAVARPADAVTNAVDDAVGGDD